MGDVAYRYCSTRRDVWLRRVLKIRAGPPPRLLSIGSAVHRVFHVSNTLFLEAAVRYRDPGEVYDYMIQYGKEALELENLDPKTADWIWRLFKILTHAFIGSMALRMIWHPGSRGYEGFLWLTEHYIDGSMLGLSQNLRVDAYGEGIVVEIKYGKPMEFHKIGLAGYALVLEANYEVPVNYGLLIYVNNGARGNPGISIQSLYLSTSLRKFFIDQRDEVIDLILSEVEPPKPPKCPEGCPYYSICNNGGRS